MAKGAEQIKIDRYPHVNLVLFILEATGRPGYHVKKFTNNTMNDADNPSLAIRDTWSAVTGQDRTGQDRTGQDRTGQDRTGQDRTVQYSTVQYSTVQYSTVQYSTVQYSTVHTLSPFLHTPTHHHHKHTLLHPPRCPHPLKLNSSTNKDHHFSFPWSWELAFGGKYHDEYLFRGMMRADNH